MTSTAYARSARKRRTATRSKRRAPIGLNVGALKHAFDVCYYPCLDATRGRPFGLYLHGNEGTEGAERGIEAITTGLGWTKVAETVVVSGRPRMRCRT